MKNPPCFPTSQILNNENPVLNYEPPPRHLETRGGGLFIEIPLNGLILEYERSYDFHIASPWSIECFWQPVSNLERFSIPRPSFRGKTRRKTSQNQLVKDAVLNHFFVFQGLDLGRQTKIVIRKNLDLFSA